MANYHDMWEMIKKYFFPISKELLLPLSCCFCGSLAINASQPQCKCNYCSNCLEILFKHGSDKCVCGIKFLGEGDNEIRENIIPAEEINKKISELKVKCPVKDCTHRTELININNHLKNCDKKKMGCNFQSVGCDTKLVDKKDLWDHLGSNVLSHNKLLIKWIFNKTSKLSIDFIDLKDQILEKELVDLDKRLSMIMKHASEENEEKQTAIDQLESDVSKIQTRNKEFGKFTRKIHNNNEKQNKAINELKQSIEIQNKEIANLREIIQNQNEENARIKNFLQDLVRQISSTTDQINIQIPMDILDPHKLEEKTNLPLINIPPILEETKVDISHTQPKANKTVKVKSKTKTKEKKIKSKNETEIKKVNKSQASTIQSETSSQSNQNIQSKPGASNLISTQINSNLYYNDYFDYDDNFDDPLTYDDYDDIYDDHDDYW